MIKSPLAPPHNGDKMTFEELLYYKQLLGDDVYLKLIRQKRTALLKASDWSVLPNSGLTEEKVQQWVAYRQLLRDVPQQFIITGNIVWPTSPNNNE